MLAENIPVPSSPVPIATIDLVQSQNSVSNLAPAAAVPVKKTKHQEDQEDVNQPAWVLSGSPWVTIIFAIVQIREVINMLKSNKPPQENEPLQVNKTRLNVCLIQSWDHFAACMRKLAFFRLHHLEFNDRHEPNLVFLWWKMTFFHFCLLLLVKSWIVSVIFNTFKSEKSTYAGGGRNRFSCPRFMETLIW